MDINELTKAIIQFRDARDWQQFHTPNQLAAAIAIEAAELQQEFLWKTTEEAKRALQDVSKKSAVEEELADILIFTLLMTKDIGSDPADIILRKLDKNAARYPVEKAKGSAAKYTEST